MPRCGATFDGNSVPPWTRGDFRGVLGVAVRSAVPNRSRQPPEGFTTPSFRLLSPFGKGDFQRTCKQLDRHSEIDRRSTSIVLRRRTVLVNVLDSRAISQPSERGSSCRP